MAPTHRLLRPPYLALERLHQRLAQAEYNMIKDYDKALFQFNSMLIFDPQKNI